MKVDLYNLKNEVVGTAELPDTVFGVAWKPALVKQVLAAQMANRREPWAHAKDRSEVSGGGKKPWRQKGTGRARHGSTRSPLWSGGGKAHGPRNDRDVFTRFTERGVKREHIYPYREIKQARRAGFDEWAKGLAARVVQGAAKVWIAFDPDVLNLGANPDFGDEPLGPTVEEVIELVYQVGLAAGRQRFGGLGIMALPYNAQTLHFICLYLLLYTLAGVVSAKG
jgi:hypothetical protein